MSTLVRLTVIHDISGLVDLKPGESRWYESVYNVQPNSAFETPEELEQYAVACTEPVTCIGVFDERGMWSAIDIDEEPEYIVMAHFSEDL